MNDLILHHYPGSPFSEKVRLMLGFKGLAWRSVIVPVILPKPDVVALTGGYRKTPFLQVGADVYCDTALIAQVLEAHQPEPTLFPLQAALAPLLAQWADSTLFWTVIPVAMQPAGQAALFAGAPPEVLKAFAADRKPFTAGMVRRTAADAAAALQGDLDALTRQLGDGRDWLFGRVASVADFSVAHCLWYLKRAGPLAALVNERPPIATWLDRVLAFGHGSSAKMSSAEAVDVAATAGGHAPAVVHPGLGFAPGDTVTVTLAGLSHDEVVLRRSDPRAGTVHVHFPRQGYQIRIAEQEQT
jgi:glutathione S-transferase